MNAVRETPTTDPTVLTKKTRPEPLSPPEGASPACSVWIATSRGFIDDTATSGRKIRIRQPA